MGKVFLDMAVSLDGFISDRNGGDGGLHNWYFSETNKSEQILEELQTGIGAMILGARAFGLYSSSTPKGKRLAGPGI
jgi:hypothetical protein